MNISMGMKDSFNRSLHSHGEEIMEMKEKHSERFNVLTTEQQIKEVRDAARFYGCSLSQFVRQSVQYSLFDFRIEKDLRDDEV